MNNLRKEILKKCGWNEEQTSYLGTMVHNLKKLDGTPIMNIIVHHIDKEVVVEWFVPTKQNGERISFSYLTKKNELNKSKTSPEITNINDMNKILEIINLNIKNEKGLFLPTKKIPELKNELKLK